LAFDGKFFGRGYGLMVYRAGQAKINHWQGRESIDFVIEDVMVL